jgi:SRSO17 transposase
LQLKGKESMDVRTRPIIEVDDSPPVLNLTPADVAALADELVAYHAEFAQLYYRKEQAHWGFKYLQGLLLPIPRKSIQPMALALEGGNVQAMQPCIGQGLWQDEALLRKHWARVEETLGEAEGVVIIDGSDFPKQGHDSVGVARQWCGALGTVANCQAGVFAAYASRQGYTLLDRRLFLPERWCTAEYQARRATCEVPEDLAFEAQPALALHMLRTLAADGHLRFRWVTADEWFGRDPDFLDGIAALGRWYFAEVAQTTHVWEARPQVGVPTGAGKGRPRTRVRVLPGEPASRPVAALAAALPASAWQPYLIKAGSKGPMVAEFALRRVVAARDDLPGPAVWVSFRRSMGDHPELKVYLSHAPAELPVTALVRLAGMRWPIETALETGKAGLGMDHYEVRTWRGWHHHMTLCSLAHHFLVRVQQRLKRGLQD